MASRSPWAIRFLANNTPTSVIGINVDGSGTVSVIDQSPRVELTEAADGWKSNMLIPCRVTGSFTINWKLTVLGSTSVSHVRKL